MADGTEWMKKKKTPEKYENEGKIGMKGICHKLFLNPLSTKHIVVDL